MAEILNYILSGCIRLYEGCIVVFNICCSGVFEWSRPLCFSMWGTEHAFTSYSSNIWFRQYTMGLTLARSFVSAKDSQCNFKEAYNLSFLSINRFIGLRHVQGNPYIPGLLFGKSHGTCWILHGCHPSISWNYWGTVSLQFFRTRIDGTFDARRSYAGDVCVA